MKQSQPVSSKRNVKATKSYERLREAPPRPTQLLNSHSRILESFGLRSKVQNESADSNHKLQGFTRVAPIALVLDTRPRTNFKQPQIERISKKFHRKRAKEMIKAIKKE